MENECQLGAVQSVNAQTRSRSEGKITLRLVYRVTQLILLRKSFSSFFTGSVLSVHCYRWLFAKIE